jgi:acyl-coenzyme A synthetase/AMP-(fatty) acid ligase
MNAPEFFGHTEIVDTRVTPLLAQGLARRPGIGAGNFLHHAIATNPMRDAPLIWLSGEIATSRGRYTALSLTDLASITERLRQTYHSLGVCSKDVVAIQTTRQVLYLIHYLALTSLGAIPAMVNERLSPAAAEDFVSFLEAKLWALDRPHANASHQYAIEELTLHVPTSNHRTVPKYTHHPKDPVLITHSSGTTGRPKAVFFQHQALLFGPTWRLFAAPTFDNRILSALPLAHNAGIAFPAMALLSGSPMFLLDELKGEPVLDAVEAFRPSKLVGFAQTFSDMAGRDLDRRDMTSLRYFSSTGDAVHEAHVTRLLAALKQKGSKDGEFIDNFGSSELAFALFRRTFSLEDRDYGRRIGRPLPFVEAAILTDDGYEVSPGSVGMLGVRSPTLSGGYWNNSALTQRSWCAGYWLTGDVVRQLEDGEFVHLDRKVDVVSATAGDVYTLPMEERILLLSKSILDCSVVASNLRGGAQAPFAFLQLRADAPNDPAMWLERVNSSFDQVGLTHVAGVVCSVSDGFLPQGPTGKVLKRTLRDQLLQRVATERAAVEPGVFLV